MKPFWAILLCFFFCSIPAFGQSSPLEKLKRLPHSPLADLWVLETFEQHRMHSQHEVAAALQSILQVPNLSFAAKARAQYGLAYLAGKKGDLKEMTQKLKHLGFLTQWKIAGPFSNEANTGVDIAFLPEKEKTYFEEISDGCIPSQSTETCVVSSSWMTHQIGKNILHHLYSPATNICTYAQTQLNTTQTGNATLYFGATGQAKIFLNGTVIFEEKQNHQADINRYKIPISLKQGNNFLTVKNCSNSSGKLEFFARISPPINGSIQPAVPTQFHTPLSYTATLPFKIDSPLKWFSKKIKSTPQNVTLKGDYARYIWLSHATGSTSEAVDHARHACNKRRSFYHCSLYATLCSNINDKRNALQSVLAQNPNNENAIVAMAKVQQDILGDSFLQKWLPKIKKLARNNPAAKCLLLQYYYSEFPFTAISFAQRIKEVKNYQIDQCVAQAMIGSSLEINTVPYLKDALRSNIFKLKNHLSLLRLLPKESNQRFAYTLQKFKNLGAIPTKIFTNFIDLLQGAGHQKLAANIVRELIRIVPGNAAYREYYGRIMLAQRDNQSAALYFTQALRIAPQNLSLRKQLQFLSNQKPFEQQHIVPTEFFLDSNNHCQIIDDACYIVDNSVIRVHENGLSSRFSQVVVKIGSKNGALDWQQYGEQFSSGQAIELLEARVFHPNGQIEQSSARATFPVSEPWYRLYYDVESEVVELPKLQPGDIVEFQFRIDDIAYSNSLGNYFGHIAPIQDYQAKKNWSFTIITPSKMQLTMDYPSSVSYEQSTDKNAATTYRFSAQNIDKLTAEPGAPNMMSLVDAVYVSTYQTWKEMEQWYLNLVRPQLVDSEEIAVLVNQLTLHKKNERQKIAAIYNWVIHNIRYVGLEFGIHGFKPYSAPQVFSRGFGDCKDTASLLVVMLRQIGVNAHVALVRTRSAGTIKTSIPSLSVFNHAIAYVPKYQLWLDGTASYHGTFDVPFEDQNIPALVIGSKQTEITHTPIMHVNPSSYKDEREVTLNTSGAATILATATATGSPFAPWMRKLFQGSNRSDALQKHLASTYPSIQITNTIFRKFKNLQESPQVEYTAFVADFAKAASGSLILPLAPPLHLKNRFIQLKSRHSPLELGPPRQTSIEAVYFFPKEFRVHSVPKSIEIDSPFGELTVEVHVDNKEIRVRRSFIFKATTVFPAQYAEFAKFCIQVDNYLQNQIVLQKESSETH